MFFLKKSERGNGRGRMGHKKKTCHNSQRAVACNMFNLKILIKDSLTTFINYLLNNLP